MTTTRFEGVQVVLLDIEGTTSPISYVYETLFPYARKRLRPFVRLASGDPDLTNALMTLREERAAEGATDAPTDVLDYAEWLMDRDSKSPGLKALQGLIWKVGYGSGALRGVVFDEVPDALKRWRAVGIRTAIYSSGSVIAQQLTFETTRFGDLTRQIDAYFDIGVGPKREASSYREIARRLGTEPGSILFVSDVMAEIEAARAAGCQVALIVRPGNAPQAGVGTTTVIQDLSSIPG